MFNNYDDLVAKINEQNQRIEQMQASINEMKCLLQSFISTANNPFLPFQIPRSSLTTASLSNPNVERDIPKTLWSASRLNGKRVRESEKIKAFLDHVFDLSEDDDINKNLEKRAARALYKRQLNNISLGVSSKMRMDIMRDERFGSLSYWKDIPREFKEPYLEQIELKARQLQIPLDRCIDRWGAYSLLSVHYRSHHNPSGAKVNKGKKPEIAPAIQEYIPVAPVEEGTPLDGLLSDEEILLSDIESDDSMISINKRLPEASSSSSSNTQPKKKRRN